MTTHSAYLKRREALVLGIEPSRGVEATQQYSYRWLSKGIKTMPGFLENESAMGNDYRVNDSAIDTWHSEGPLGGKVTEDGIGYLLAGMFPTVTTTDDTLGNYTHKFEYDSTVEAKSLSIWDVRPSTTRLYKSCVLDNLNLSVEVGESGAWLEASTTVKGWKHEDVTGVEPAFVAEKEFTSRMVKVYLADDVVGLDDTANSQVKPRRIELAIEQTKTTDHSVGDGEQPEFDKGVFDVRGTMVIKYKKTDYEEDYFANKIHAMKIAIENGGVVLNFVATKVRFRELTDSDDRDGIVTQEISYYCESDDTNGGHAIVPELTNTVASYAAA